MQIATEEKIIEVNEVSMMFNSSSEKIDSLKEYLVKLATRKLFFQEFWAINDISFVIKRGETFGIIGDNGAGKSTLLKIIAGVIKPTKGSTRLKGTLAPLIELGAGFDMDLNAKENIFLNGAILGFSRSFIRQKLDQIVDFSELHESLELPIKNYSSGMIARLGFAIATIVEPDILIVDEILAVGDYKFQQKCQDKISSMLEKKTTIVIVSHSLAQIEAMCDRVLWLEQSRLKMIGKAQEVCAKYKSV